MATEAAAPPPSPPARRLSTPKPLDVVADHAASCGDLIQPKSLVEEVRARQAAAARAWNGHDLVSLGDGAPKRRRDRRSFHGRTAFEVARARPVHSVMHELRCFFDPACGCTGYKGHVPGTLCNAYLASSSLPGIT